METMKSAVLDMKQLAEYLNLGMNAAYSLVRQENFPAIRVGKRILVPIIELETWIRDNSYKRLVI